MSGLSKGVEHHSDSDAHLGRRSDRHASRGHRPPGHGRRGVESDLHPGRPVVYIATGSNFPDALSPGPAAAKQGGPLLLVDRDSMSQVVRDELTRLKPKRIVVVGFALSVGDALAADLAGYAENRNLIRLGGTDRYDTSEQLNRAAFRTAKTVFLATGENFPDALSGATAAGYANSPLFAVPPTCVPNDIKAGGATRVVLFGGPGTLSDAVAKLAPCS
ncbi:cell wall-binding repeat-containing protein [Rathayibacter rathayi]|uniref:cell wall-binding repeat-containing protein n=1 Tax=Rathayibacter rathayi TaxID=33887 RepID=UPI000CE88376|nr:cell wall-binding repeat-containing protein [Rathayibacter rathayi]PPG90271.1 hypothetical protein C5C47_01660 [Rathayibacter rathayi]